MGTPALMSRYAFYSVCWKMTILRSPVSSRFLYRQPGHSIGLTLNHPNRSLATSERSDDASKSSRPLPTLSKSSKHGVDASESVEGQEDPNLISQSYQHKPAIK